MEILEVNITNELGSSEAPLLGKSGEVIGVLNGGLKDIFIFHPIRHHVGNLGFSWHDFRKC